MTSIDRPAYEEVLGFCDVELHFVLSTPLLHKAKDTFDVGKVAGNWNYSSGIIGVLYEVSSWKGRVQFKVIHVNEEENRAKYRALGNSAGHMHNVTLMVCHTNELRTSS